MEAVKAAILARFPSGLTVRGFPSPEGASGKLEVQVVGGPMLHSKDGGAGYCDTPEKIEVILQGIAEHAIKSGSKLDTVATDTSDFKGGSSDPMMMIVQVALIVGFVYYVVPMFTN
jgi:hypothetical protein